MRVNYFIAICISIVFSVSSCNRSNDVDQSSPLNQECVDLGLPSGKLWAKCNVGANKEEDFGLYFAWGEITGYSQDTLDGRYFDLV